MSLWPAQLSLSVSSPSRWESTPSGFFDDAHVCAWNTPRMLDDEDDFDERRATSMSLPFGRDDFKAGDFFQRDENVLPMLPSQKTVDPMMLHDNCRDFASDGYFRDGRTSFTPFSGNSFSADKRQRRHGDGETYLCAAPAATAFGFFCTEDEQEEDDESEIERSNFFFSTTTTTTTTTKKASDAHCIDDDDDDDDGDDLQVKRHTEDGVLRSRGRRKSKRSNGDDDEYRHDEDEDEDDDEDDDDCAYKEDDDDEDYQPPYPLKRGMRRPSQQRQGRKQRANSDDVVDEDDAPQQRTTGRGRRKRAVSLKRTDAPSCKVSSRVFALYLLFAGRLPSRRPTFVPEDDWAALQQRAPSPEHSGSLISITDMSEVSVTVRLPTSYDLVVHSRANYGPELTEHTESIKTRFRWWSDCALPELAPIRNRCSAHECIDRQITLPAELLASSRIRALWREQDSTTLCAEFASFFVEILKAYLHPDDRDSLDREGFGRTRRKPQSWPQHRNAFNMVLNQFIERNKL